MLFQMSWQNDIQESLIFQLSRQLPNSDFSTYVKGADNFQYL